MKMANLRGVVQVAIGGNVVRLPVIVECEWQEREPAACLNAGWIPVSILRIDPDMTPNVIHEIEEAICGSDVALDKVELVDE